MSTNDPFASEDSRPSISFKDAAIGLTYAGRVVEAPTIVQSRDYQTGQPAFWPDGNPKQSVVTVLEIDGVEYGLWAPKPSSMFAAIAAAQKAAGSQIAVGGTLQVSLIGEKPSDNPRFNAQKLYSAVYTPGDPFAQVGGQPVQAPAAPSVPAAAPVSAPLPQAPAPATEDPASKVRQLIALGLDDTKIAAALGVDASVVATFRAA